MPKSKTEVKLVSYGIYSQWDSESKDLPKLLKFTTDIPAEIDIEFGFIVNIKKAKGKQLHYCIKHPGILDENGQLRAAFRGTVYVRDNNWSFFLGDTIWPPIADKLGAWHLSLELDGKLIAEKTFEIQNQL
ncbi:DUF3859 domain-containing protein [Agaribacterium haliotis]|uniref:DUF3859 domain-containing protein n=1 Tax=Agaribacterium haliotis TaxID=2013869 RepID=UPI000BB553E7|nr:DUF3859 domain-containing protein [Agaribacterium haliotis]